MTDTKHEHRWVEQGKSGDKPDAHARRVYCESCGAQGWQPNRGPWRVIEVKR